MTARRRHQMIRLVRSPLRRPRYVGEHVVLWAKKSCASLRGSEEDVEAREAEVVETVVRM